VSGLLIFPWRIEQVGESDYLPSDLHRRFYVIGRLKPGVTARPATENLMRLRPQLAKEYQRPKTGSRCG